MFLAQDRRTLRTCSVSPSEAGTRATPEARCTERNDSGALDRRRGRSWGASKTRRRSSDPLGLGKRCRRTHALPHPLQAPKRRQSPPRSLHSRSQGPRSRPALADIAAFDSYGGEPLLRSWPSTPFCPAAWPARQLRCGTEEARRIRAGSAWPGPEMKLLGASLWLARKGPVRLASVERMRERPPKRGRLLISPWDDLLQEL